MTLILTILLTASIAAWEYFRPHQFTGYVVGKIYIPAHTTDQQVREYQKCYVTPVVPFRSSTPEKVGAAYKLYVATGEETHFAFVDQTTFFNTPCGAKITIPI